MPIIPVLIALSAARMDHCNICRYRWCLQAGLAGEPSSSAPGRAIPFEIGLMEKSHQGVPDDASSDRDKTFFAYTRLIIQSQHLASITNDIYLWIILSLPSLSYTDVRRMQTDKLETQHNRSERSRPGPSSTLSQAYTSSLHVNLVRPTPLRESSSPSG